MIEDKTTRGLSPYLRVPAQDGAEAFIEALVTYGVEYIFINSGTDTFPLQEAISRRLEQGRDVPKVILCLDEMMGLSAAQGYFQVTGRTQVVLVHVDAGTAQLGGALHNAQRAHTGVLLCAGRAPYSFLGEFPGGRDLSIHWIQEQRDQAGIVRPFTKWDYEIHRAEMTGFIVHRALQVASAQPSGPVYLVLPRESLMEPLSEILFPDPTRHALPTTPTGDPSAIRTIANDLSHAEYPLIIVGDIGRNPTAISALIELAETAGARVATGPTRMGFPTDHPLWVGGTPDPHLPNADFVLVIDTDVPWIPSKTNLRAGSKVVRVDIDPVKESMPLWSFPSDIVLHADSSKAIPLITQELKISLNTRDADTVAKRTSTIKADTAARLDALEREDFSLKDNNPIATQWLLRCLAETLPPEALILEETVTSRYRLHEVLPRTQRGDFLTSNGASLGWALGAAVGAKLAAPDRTVVALVGDGTFVYGAPTSALWAANRYDSPFLTVIFNNQEHFATRRSLQNFYPDSASARTETWIGMDINPSPDYASLAQALDAYGERVSDPAEIIPALKRGLEEVKNGRSAVIDVLIRRV